MNSVQIVGRLVRDPELRKVGSESISQVRFTVAVDRPFGRSGEEKKADFISCVAWRQSADYLTNYGTKGRLVAVNGRIETGSYEKDGATKYTTDIVVDRVTFLDRKPDAKGEAAAPAEPETADVPF